MYISRNTGGFYDKNIHTDIPKDAIEISQADYLALLDGQSCGKVISFDSDNKPCLVAPPPQTKDTRNILRARAYADPLNGSDKFLSEYLRETAMGNTDIAKIAMQKAVARAEEIMEQYP